jgi:hypothetical protein
VRLLAARNRCLLAICQAPQPLLRVPRAEEVPLARPFLKTVFTSLLLYLAEGGGRGKVLLDKDAASERGGRENVLLDA